MSIACKVNLIYNLGPQGWTETFYRLSPTIPAAANVPLSFLQAAMKLRPHACTLEATRSQEVHGLRRIYLDFAQVGGLHTRRPDVASTAAYCWIQFAGGYGRPYYFRGLPDSLVRRTAAGIDNPPPELLAGIQSYFAAMQAADLRGRLRARSEPWHRVRKLVAGGDDGDLVRVEIDGAMDVQPGDFVYFGERKNLLVSPGKAYWVETVEPGAVTLFAPWPAGLVDQWTTGLRVKRLRYEYPPLESIEFRAFSSRQTGPRYHPMTWEPLQPRAVPISTCQRIVDYARQPYQVAMRFRAEDLGDEQNVRWFVPTQYLDRKFSPPLLTDGPRLTTIPYAHPFGSRHWELSEWPELPIGETGQRSRIRGRQRTFLTAQGLAGSESAWTDADATLDRPLKYSPATGWP